jgi:hypothetical protein
MFYVYAYFEPGCERPFYVGKGTRYRSNAHLKRTHNTALARRIAALQRNGLKPDVRRLYFGSDEQCKAEEVRLIRLFGREDLRRGPLLNCTDGGDGMVNRVRHKRELELLRTAARRQWNNEFTREKKLPALWSPGGIPPLARTDYWVQSRGAPH